MEYDRQKIIEQLDRALKLPLEHLFYVGIQRRPLSSSIGTLIPVPRFIITLSGSKHIEANLDNGEDRQGFINAGQAIYGAPNNWIGELWDSAHEMVSISILPRMIRAVYICHNGIEPPPYPLPHPTLFYHVHKPMDQFGTATIRALNYATILATPKYHPAGGEDILHSLLKQVREMLFLDTTEQPTKEHFLWHEIFNFVSTNFTQPLSREIVATRYHIHPSHLSRLFRQKLNMGFLEYVNDQRLALAEDLLHNPELNIDSIANSCGFKYTSYFIRFFKKKYGCSPGSFRELIGA